MIENGSSGGVGPLPPHEPHDGFLELCAVATTGSLSAEERKRLEEHLQQCPACREALAQYHALISEVIPNLAPEPSPDEFGDSSRHWSLEQAEASLFARLNQEGEVSQLETSQTQESISESERLFKAGSDAGETLWRHVWWQYAAGLLLAAALGFSLYRTGIQRGVETAHLAPPAMPSPPSLVQQGSASAANDQSSVPKQLAATDAQVVELRAQLEARTKEVADLKAQHSQLENTLGDRDADRASLSQDRADLERQLELAQTNLQAAQQKLDSVTSRGTQDAEQIAALQNRITELTSSIHERDQDVAREQELLDHDRDIRELMGSRDLYIAEVYDVAKTGDTQKPFGRVFYTKGKSLIFYAYDLDQQTGIKNASTFQAWGRRGPERDQAVNLGIFYQDNASKKRWVVKSTNPKTLAQIDAVFVTVEPNGGSTHPSTKPLLFAYLRVEPNHP